MWMGGFDKFKDKIMINVDASLKANKQRVPIKCVRMVAKALSKHSPKIVMVISIVHRRLHYGH